MEGEAVGAEVDEFILIVRTGGYLYGEAEADDRFAGSVRPVFGKFLALEGRSAEEIDRKAHDRVSQAIALGAGGHAIEKAGPFAALVGLRDVEARGLFEDFKGAYVFGDEGLHGELSVFDEQQGIECDVAGGVSVARAREIHVHGQVAPAPGYEFLGSAGQGQKNGDEP